MTTPIWMSKLFVSKSQPWRIQHIMIDRINGAERQLSVAYQEASPLFRFLPPFIPEKYRRWL